MQTTRFPFHFGLFYHAVIGLLKREPDIKNCSGSDGYYDFVYQPKNEKEQELFKEQVQIIKQWLDLFEIKFSETRVDFQHPYDQDFDKGNGVLRIIVKHYLENKI